MYHVTHDSRDYPNAAELIFTGPLNRPPKTAKLELDKTQLPVNLRNVIAGTFEEAIKNDLHPDPVMGGRSPKRHHLTTAHDPKEMEVTRYALATERTRQAITEDFQAKLGEKGIRLGRAPVIATVRLGNLAESRGRRDTPVGR